MKNTFLQKHIQYLTECYEEENGSLEFINFFKRKANLFHHFFEGKEVLLTDEERYLNIDTDLAESIQTTLTFRGAEVQLTYGSIFLTGKFQDRFGEKTICIPVFLFQAKIEKKESNYYLSVDRESHEINPSFLKIASTLFTNSTDEVKPLEFPLNYSNLHRFFLQFNETEDLLITNKLITYPNLISEKSTRKTYHKKQLDQLKTSFSITAASTLFIEEVQINKNKVVNELNKIQNEQNYSIPLKLLLGDDPLIGAKSKKESIWTISLNASQQNALSNSNSPLSVIIGPPGTGKTHTISQIALNACLNDERVLIVSKNDEAVDVVLSKVSPYFSNHIGTVRVGGAKYRNKQRSILKSVKTLSYDPLTDLGVKSEWVEEYVANIETLSKNLEHSIHKEFSRSFFDKKESGNRFIKLIRRFFPEKDPKIDHLDEIHSKLYDSHQISFEVISSHFKDKIKRKLKGSNKFSKNYDSSKSKKILDEISNFKRHLWDLSTEVNYDEIFKIFPIWFSRLSELDREVPFQKEIFDLVIIDESSMCDVASCIPVLQRAKRVIICGDPMQLNHLSFLSQMKQDEKKKKYSFIKDSKIVDYRRNSILDYALDKVSPQNISFLNQHYRSKTPIIRGSNELFYNNQLELMRPSLPTSESIFHHQVENSIIDPEKKYNPQEANTIIKLLKQIQNTSNLKDSSIGILSPFRAQVDYLQEVVSENFDYTFIEKRNLKINTPYGFQGDERDIMILTLVLNNSSSSQQFRYLSKEKVMNVAVTRAKHIQHFVYSFQSNHFSKNGILPQLLFGTSKLRSPESEDSNYSTCLDDLKEVLDSLSLEYEIGFNHSNTYLDILIKINNQLLAIDLIGFSGRYEKPLTLEQFTALHYIGISVFPLSFNAWRQKKELVISKLENWVEGHKNK